MVRITILYPNSQGARFDLRYYVETPMSSPATRRSTITTAGSEDPPAGSDVSGTTFLPASHTHANATLIRLERRHDGQASDGKAPAVSVRRSSRKRENQK